MNKPGYPTHYQLPSGRSTESVAEFEQAWRELAQPIERGMGVQLSGYDLSGIVFIDDKGVKLTVPVEVAMFVKRLWDNQRFKGWS